MSVFVRPETSPLEIILIAAVVLFLVCIFAVVILTSMAITSMRARHDTETGVNLTRWGGNYVSERDEKDHEPYHDETIFDSLSRRSSLFAQDLKRELASIKAAISLQQPGDSITGESGWRSSLRKLSLASEAQSRRESKGDTKSGWLGCEDFPVSATGRENATGEPRRRSSRFLGKEPGKDLEAQVE